MSDFNQPTNYILGKIKAKLVADGTMARIDARKAKHEAKAKRLGFLNAQAAFNEMGKAFLVYANE